jgi:hypothetical protein
MLYKFRSKASGDVVMLPAHGDALLRLLGREPAARGIFEPAHMPALLAALEAAVAQPEAAAGQADALATEPAPDALPAVGLRQRLWPMIDLLRRSQAAAEPVVWGV